MSAEARSAKVDDADDATDDADDATDDADDTDGMETTVRWLKNLRMWAAVAVIGGIVAIAMWPEALEVDVVQVERRAMQVTIDEEGETRVRERFVISAPVAGRITRIELEPGDAVHRGVTELVRMTPQEAPLLAGPDWAVAGF